MPIPGEGDAIPAGKLADWHSEGTFAARSDPRRCDPRSPADDVAIVLGFIMAVVVSTICGGWYGETIPVLIFSCDDVCFLRILPAASAEYQVLGVAAGCLSDD